PPPDGLVAVLVCSKPIQPAAATAAARASARIVFFMAYPRARHTPRAIVNRSLFAGMPRVVGERQYSRREDLVIERVGDLVISLRAGNACDEITKSPDQEFTKSLRDTDTHSAQIIAQSFAGAAECQFVPRDRIRVKQPRIQAFIVAAQLSAEDGRGIDDDDRCVARVRINIDEAVECDLEAGFLASLTNRRGPKLF